MNHWPFIIAAYALTIAGTLGLTGWSWAAMRRAERQADSLRGKSPPPWVSSEVETRFSTSLETNGNTSDSVA